MKYPLIEDTCVICGNPIPEGTWVCPCCINKIKYEDEAPPAPDPPENSDE